MNSKQKQGTGGSHVLKRVGKAAVALVTAAATLAAGLVTTGTAFATTVTGLPGYNSNASFRYTFSTNGRTTYGEQALGPIAVKDGRYAYCVQADTLTDMNPNNGTWNTITNDATATKVAYIADKYKDDHSDLTQAAITYLIHMHYDQHGGPEYMNAIGAAGLKDGNWNDVVNTANNIWNNTSVPSNVQASYQYTQGKRKGSVNPGIMDVNKHYVAGVNFTATLNGPAKFDQTGTNTLSGTTNGQEQHFAWTATGNGRVTYSVSWKVPKLALLNSPAQNLASARDPETQTASVTFQVQRDFQPTASTQTSRKQVVRGSPVEDNVKSGVATGDQWADNIPVTFKGYYFIGGKNQILHLEKRGDKESITDYLQRLRDTDGITQVGAAVTTFTGANQTNTVRAKATSGVISKDTANGLDDYVVTDDDAGKFGTWVWVEMKNEQTQQDYIKGDFADTEGRRPAERPSPPVWSSRLT